MPTTQEFLEAILPAEGLKCGAIFEGKRVTHTFFPTCKELADFLLIQDGLGRTVYHACASYKTADSRTKANVLAARSLWLDIDCGEGKPYADQQEAAENVHRFCSAVGIPAPLYVGSGVGLHVYWPLDQSLDPKEWEAYARGLKALCRQADLRAGAERTGDIASILRPPGSHHRKALPVIVRAGPLAGPFPLRGFATLLAEPAQGGARPPAILRPVQSGGGSELARGPATLSAAVGAIYEPAYAEKIVEQCAQVAAIKDRRGAVPEPHWKAAAGVLAFCEDGLKKAEEWCSDWPQWGAEITTKINRSKRLSGATTCEHFAEVVDFNVCKTCPHFGKINSPISLGRREWTDHKSQPLLASVEDVSSSDSQSASPYSQLVELPDIPAPFAWSSKQQLMFLGEKKDGQPHNTIVSEYPIFLSSVQTGEVNRGRFSYTFSQFLPKVGWLAISLPAKTLMGQGGVAELFDGGASIQEKDLFRKFVVLSIDQFNRSNNLLVRYEQFGWKNADSFLCGTQLYSAEGVSPVVGSDELKIRAGWLGPTKQGSIGVWSETMGELFSHKGFEPHVFVLLASFGAPLMRFNSETEGGAIISLVSADSGTGKSTALEAAGSVWGGKRGTDLTEIDTGVSKAITLATLGNLPAVFDELSRRDPEYVRDFVLMFTNGRDKMRGTTEGTIKHMAASWQTLLLTASNLSMVDTLNSLGGTDAPSFRVLEFPAEMGDNVMSHARGEALKKALASNAGHAGAVFLRYLTQKDVSPILPRMIQEMTEVVWETTHLSSQHRFWVRAIAATAVAAQIVEKLKLLPFPAQRIIDWVKDFVMGYTPSTITGQKDKAASALAQFLTEHVNTMLVVPHGTRAGRVPYQKPLLEPKGAHLYVRHEQDSGTLYIAETVFRKWAVEKGLLVRAIVSDLEKNAILRQRRLVTLGAGTDYITGQAWCLELDGHHPAVSGMLRPIEERKVKIHATSQENSPAELQGRR